LSTAGHDVTVGSRDPEAARDQWTGPAAGFATTADAVRDATVVINPATGWPSAAVSS
jgi:3-hydroxyisobutyrate dehydrogenase-like beta-hydroxyacid dehydrogenase